jgi:hypothetical protein
MLSAQAKGIAAGTKGADATKQGFNIIRNQITPRLGGPLGFATAHQLKAAKIAEDEFLSLKGEVPGKLPFGLAGALAKEAVSVIEHKHTEWWNAARKAEAELSAGKISEDDFNKAIEELAKRAIEDIKYVPDRSFADMIAQEFEEE